ncbi:MAG TPA: DISARM system helicase DrmA [Polyangia bacterium]|nr:DISARM system helicase DrmA [Polyangia bacterium]
MAASRPVEVRQHLIAALRADLVGPFLPESGDSPRSEEVLPLPPSRWYLCGFLAPEQGRAPEQQVEEGELGEGDDDEEASASQEPEPKRKSLLPASLGVSVFVPDGDAKDVVTARVSFADYESVDGGEGGEEAEGRRKHEWRRMPRGPVDVDVLIEPQVLAKGIPLPGFPDLVLTGVAEKVSAPGLPKGVRALSLFLVNRRQPALRGREDEAYIFQVELEVRCAKGFVPRPNVRGEGSDDRDEQVADLQFRNRVEYVVGHGIAAEPVEEDGRVVAVRTTWLPTATVPRVKTRDNVPDVLVGMEDLAALPDAATARAKLSPLVEHYAAWIAAQKATRLDTPGRRSTLEALLRRAERARERIAAGIDLLEQDPLAFDAFRIANRAMADAARRRSPDRYKGGAQPAWRLFQLAFVLLALPGLADETREDRETVELIFFPTGGGKTEAYLGVIAFNLVLRRLRGQDRPDGGLGTAVLLRYTLRLLTLDQLGRAATLICALELIRKTDPRLGQVRFSLGLWVGKSATANTLEEVARAITEYRNSTSAVAQSPFPLPACPWCARPLGKDSLELKPNRTHPDEVLIGCSDFHCDFAASRNPEGLPVLFVDEQIYRELPSFIVATVDKFAMLPWRGETGAFFGRVHSRIGRRFFGPMDGAAPPPQSAKLPEGLRPPDLIVQDELHLISGPLGTMVGLYETAIEGLCMRTRPDGKVVRPKIIASTATVRRADKQIQALFGRTGVDVFPPNGVDQSESFFATVDSGPGREYLGVAAPGRAVKAILLRVYVALLGAAQRHFDSKGAGDQAADPYMTLVGYFNSLRELGGMRRLVEDEVRRLCLMREERRPVGFKGPHPWVANREIKVEPVELTSRESTYMIAKAKDLLGRHHTDEQHVDVALASNMISVGVDIERLGLMVVAGQPKTTSEYIQSSSRVGRDVNRPGLVVTVMNVHRPRDRSHYERFRTYHESFYRFVEATSVTPFSGPAIERGLCGTLVALVRLRTPALTPPTAVRLLEAERASTGNEAAKTIADRARRQPQRGDAADADRLGEAIFGRCKHLLDTWQRIARKATEGAGERVYSPYDRECRNKKALLHTVLEENATEDEEDFSAATSMRDVEPSVHLWVERQRLGKKGPSNG